jgi:RNA polymerase sigma factor (sigma-70 family)
MSDAKEARRLFRLFRESGRRTRAACYRFLTDPWLHEIAKEEAAQILRTYRADEGWRDEVVQAAMVSLEKDFLAGKSLRLDMSSPAAFAVSLRHSVARHCRRPVRRLIRLRSTEPLIEDLAAGDKRPGIETRLDVEAALKKLPEPRQTVLFMRIARYRVEEIAKSLHLSVAQVRRNLRKGYEFLRELLGER